MGNYDSGHILGCLNFLISQRFLLEREDFYDNKYYKNGVDGSCRKF
jgi:hypothetical protein